MSDRDRRIPLALRIAARLLPSDTREDVLGDLLEVWHGPLRHRPRAARIRWLLRQPLAALAARRPQRRAVRLSARGGRTRVRRAALRPGSGLGFSWLDVKLGFRMLGKHPLITVVVGLTLALGIPAALMPTHILTLFHRPLPVEEGDRVVGIRNWNVETGGPAVRPLHDFAVWRDRLAGFAVLAAARTDPWNVHSPDGRAAEVRGAEVSASTFEMLRVPPLMGRTLIAADEVEGAPDVVVVSADLWASRFGSDPAIVGKVIGIGRRPHTVVGVMPEGFLFPWLDHLWIPLRADPTDYAVGSGPDLLVFGRLADGISREQAEAELTTVGASLAREWPDTHQVLRPEIVSVPLLAFGEPAAGPGATREILFLQIFCFALLAVVCGNVGTLILARTSTRVSEISVRTALGASRGRILSQLFMESFVLAVGATLVGLVLAQYLLSRFANVVLDGGTPYWFSVGLAPRSILIALGLAAACAVAAGVLPAIRATAPDIQRSLQRTSTGTSVRFGPLTTILVVAEVALSVGFLCFGAAAMKSFMGNRLANAGTELAPYLIASLRTPWVDPTEDESDAYAAEFRGRVARNHEALLEALRAEASVGRVAMGAQLPGIPYPDRPIALEGDDETDGAFTVSVTTGRVHIDYFRDLRIEVLEGRDFSSADVAGEEGAHRPSVVVNRRFVERVFGGGDAVGRRFRYAVADGGEPGDWYEIVGVVETFGTNILNPERGDAVYHPLAAADLHPMRYIIEVDGSPVAFTPRLRQIAAQVDPDAIVQEPRALTEIVERNLIQYRLVTLLIFVLSSMGMVLAATGLYALMSFTVSQRTREIGIRTALGASGRDVVATIARRALLQLGAGVALGSGLGWWLVSDVALQSEFDVGSVPLLLLCVAAAVTAFAGLACLAPTLRGLRIQPTEALREA